MKIKTFKYFILYILLILLSFFLIKNYPNFSSYITNYLALKQLENLKNKETIKLENLENFINNIDVSNLNNIKTNFEKLMSIQLLDNFEKWNLSWVSKTDIANLYVITDQIDKAESLIKNKVEYDYQDFYNLWNIYFFKAYKKFSNNWTWYIEDLQNAISYYNYALETIPNYKRKDFIINNDNLAKNFLSILYFYECNSFFVRLINKNIKLLQTLDKIKETVKKQLRELRKWENYDKIRQCILQFEADAVKNLSIIEENEKFFQETKKWIINLMKNYIKKENICYKNKSLFEEKYEKSLDFSIEYFINFNDKQEKLLYIFQKWKLQDIEKLCQNRSKLAKNQSEENEKMMKNFNNMRDLLEQNKQPTKPQNNWEKKAKLWPQELKKIEEETKNIEKKAKETLKKIQERKTLKNYNPMDYINRIFNGFYGNKEDFIKWKKENSTWK